jgi:biopolymer transport protein ExbD
MTASLSSENRAEPNLTPILDMVFQLITFFMLVCNFKAASLDMSLKLPVVGSARPVETKGAVDLLILNVNKEGNLMVFGSPVKEVEAYIKNEANGSRRIARRKNPNIQRGEELPTMVVVRADKSTPFAQLNRVVKTCIEEGFRSFALKAKSTAE